MLHAFLVTLPFFALVLCGWGATRLGWFREDAIAGLNAFVLFFALPCMLFRFAATTPIARLADPGVVMSCALAALAMVALVVGVSRRAGVPWRDTAYGALVAAFPNSGFLGVPLLVALHGAPAAAPAIVSMAFDMVVTTSLCLALAQLGSGAGGGVPAAFGRALLAITKNPMAWAILAGSAASAFGNPLPAVAMKTVGLLADAASPVALFTLGAVLARAQRLASAGAAVAGGRWSADVAVIVLAKLVLHPLATWGAVHAVRAAGFAVDDFTLAVLVLVAALPSASNVVMLAERWGADAGRIARIVMATTVVAVVSFPLADAWVWR